MFLSLARNAITRKLDSRVRACGVVARDVPEASPREEIIGTRNRFARSFQREFHLRAVVVPPLVTGDTFVLSEREIWRRGLAFGAISIQLSKIKSLCEADGECSGSLLRIETQVICIEIVRSINRFIVIFTFMMLHCILFNETLFLLLYAHVDIVKV